jgi:hypothetical protein
MAGLRQMLKRFQKFVRYGDTDKDTPFPDEVKWLTDSVKLSERKEPETEPVPRARVKCRERTPS